jgi:hypothetical protein
MSPRSRRIAGSPERLCASGEVKVGVADPAGAAARLVPEGDAGAALPAAPPRPA